MFKMFTKLFGYLITKSLTCVQPREFKDQDHDDIICTGDIMAFEYGKLKVNVSDIKDELCEAYGMEWPVIKDRALKHFRAGLHA